MDHDYAPRLRRSIGAAPGDGPFSRTYDPPVMLRNGDRAISNRHRNSIGFSERSAMNRSVFTGKARCADLITASALGAILLGLLFTLPGCPNSQGNNSSPKDNGPSAESGQREKDLDASGNASEGEKGSGPDTAKAGNEQENGEGDGLPPEEKTWSWRLGFMRGPSNPSLRSPRTSSPEHRGPLSSAQRYSSD